MSIRRKQLRLEGMRVFRSEEKILRFFLGAVVSIYIPDHKSPRKDLYSGTFVSAPGTLVLRSELHIFHLLGLPPFQHAGRQFSFPARI